MKWVNASDRMPVENKMYVVRTAYSDAPCVREYISGSFVNYDGYKVVKWLDETESPAPDGWVSEAAKKIVENLGEYVSRLDKRGLGLPMGDEVAVMQMEHLVEQILINPDSDIEVPEY